MTDASINNGNEQILRLLSELRSEFTSFKSQLLEKIATFDELNQTFLQELRSLKKSLNSLNLQANSVKRSKQSPTTVKDRELLTFLQMDIPNHLRATYTLVLDHGAVAASDVSALLGISLSQASAQLKQLAETYDLLDWRKGDKRKNESPHKKYYYFVNRKPTTQKKLANLVISH